MDGLYEQFRIALHQIWRRRWMALGVAWGVCLVGWLVIALIPNSYEAKARLFVQAQNILPSDASSPADRQNDLLRLKQTLTSNENLARIVRRTDLNSLVRSERDLADQVAGLRQRIEIVAQAQQNFTPTTDGIIEIKARSNVRGLTNAENARTAAAVAQALVEMFQEGNIAGDRQTGQSLQFLDEELRRREGALQEAEQRRVEFEQRFLGVLPGEGSISQRMSAARSELGNIDQQIAAAQSALGAMRGQLAATPAQLPVDGAGGGGGVSRELATLEVQLAQYQSRGFTDQHPDVIALRSQIARLRPMAQEESRNGGGGISNPSYVSLRAMMAEREGQLAAAQARRNQIQSDLSQLTSRQATEPGLAAEQARLNRDYDVLKNQYDRLLADREQVRLRSDAQQRTSSLNVQVVEPPRQPSLPAAPNRPLFLSLVLVVAILIGIGAAFVSGQLQTTFPTRNRLAEITGLAVLGSVSEVLLAPEKSRRRQRAVWLTGGAAALAALWGVLMLVEFWQRGALA